MNVVPLPDPRDAIMADLNQKLDAFFGAGGKAQQIASGVSAEAPAFGTTTHSNKLRAERDKVAPTLKALSESGASAAQAAKECGMASKRALLIARENGFKFSS